MISILKDAVANVNFSIWDLEKLAESCIRVAPEQTSDLLREVLKSANAEVRTRVASIIGRIAPQLA